MLLLLLLVSLLSAASVRAAVVAVAPGPGETYQTGASCNVTYTPDSSGVWKNLQIDLMTGSNGNMTVVTNVASNIDGTSGANPTILSWTCPDVTLNAAIYFYRLSDPTDDSTTPSYTTRFTIASSTGATTPAPYPTQPDGEQVSWGLGSVVSSGNSSASNGNSAMTISTTSTASGSWAPTTVSSSSSNTSNNMGPAGANLISESASACGWNNLCPESSPCCSEYGVCGSGRSCLAGCDPNGSFNFTACMPFSAFQPGVEYRYQFADMSKIKMLEEGDSWNGDADNYDFIFDSIGDLNHDPITEGLLRLSLTKENNGTRISSTNSLLYGNVTARIQSVAMEGVVTAFILMSGTKDEVDWEFTTGNTTTALTNYFWLGDVGNYTAGGTSEAIDRNSTFHDFGISWTPDTLCWIIDGVVVRTVNKADTQDAIVPGLFHYPQTPARVELSIWPAGLNVSSPGTIEWAGGLIDWNSALYAANQSFVSFVESINVTAFQDSNLTYLPTLDGLLSLTVNTSSLSGSAASNSSPSTSPESWATATTSQSSTTVWWTPAVTSSSTTSPASWKRRRAVDLGRPYFVRSPTGNITSFVYIGNSSTGQPEVVGSNASVLITDQSSNGFSIWEPTSMSMGWSPAAGEGSGDSNAGVVATTLTDSAGIPTATITSPISLNATVADGDTLADKWNRLSKGAHAGVYVAGGTVVVLLVLGISFFWKKASTGQASAGYSEINKGEMQPSEKAYSGGALAPGEQLYQGGVMPAGALSVTSYPPSLPPATPPPPSRSTSVSSSQVQYETGYVPSSQLRAQRGNGVSGYGV